MRTGTSKVRTAIAPVAALVLAGAGFAVGRASAPSGSAAAAPESASTSRTAEGASDGAVSAADAERFSLMWTLRGDAVWVERDGGSTKLVLKGPDRDVLWFTDRPVRKSGRMTMAKFTAAWDDPQFEDDPPNAAVTVALAGDGRDGESARRRVDAVVELSSPRFDAASDTLTFACRCRVGDVDASWLLSTGAERPVAGDVALLVDPYEAPTPPTDGPTDGGPDGGFGTEIGPRPRCIIFWAPQTDDWRGGYPGFPDDPGPYSKVLDYGKWDTDEWRDKPSYFIEKPFTPGFTSTYGVVATQGGAFRGCGVWVRLDLGRGYQVEIALTSGPRSPFRDPDYELRCTIFSPDGRPHDAVAAGRCREKKRDLSFGPKVQVEFDRGGYPS